MGRMVERQKHKCRDEDGREHTIIEYQEMIDTSTADGPSAVPGLKTLMDSEGRHCNFIDANTFEIVATGQIVRKV